MRISDWSSDVCSSDLADRVQHEIEPVLARRPVHQLDHHVGGAGQEGEEYRRGEGDIDGIADEARVTQQERKSVVKGTSGAGRVDFGGRRSIKKKKKQREYDRR